MYGIDSSPKQRMRPHRVLVVGGLARLEQQYRCCSDDTVSVEVANTNSSRLEASISAADSVLVIVPNISHSAVQSVRRHARRYGLRVDHAKSPSAKHVSEHIRALALEGGQK